MKESLAFLNYDFLEHHLECVRREIDDRNGLSPLAGRLNLQVTQLEVSCLGHLGYSPPLSYCAS